MILKFNQYQKYSKIPSIIYADLESLIKKVDGCKNNCENSTSTKVAEHALSDFSISSISSPKST